MTEGTSKTPSIQPFVDLMQDAEVPNEAIASFQFHYRRLLEGERGFLSEKNIQPVEQLPDAEQFERYIEAGRTAMPSVVLIKLNGGLGTSMGLERAKSLLLVRDDLSFLDLIARQVLALRSLVGTDIPLLLMNSFRTAEDSERVLSGYPALKVDDLPLGFVQNMVPKVLERELTPASDERQPELGWCPPGHGDLYTAIKASSTLERLLDHGVEYAFVSNADNLGASLEPSLLGFMVTEDLDFMLEAADRTPADRKGGHLCRLQDGRLALRESAQCPPEDEKTFQDVRLHRYFNTNNVWLHLPTLGRLLDEHGGFLPLPTVVNNKTLDPRDPKSPSVFQLETVMGTAISLFPKSAAVRVSRRRFSPVKNTNDLLAVRSDAYELGSDGLIMLSTGRTEPPLIQLDRDFFKLIDEFERRFPSGPPSLRLCDRLRVEGDVTFGSAVKVNGDVEVLARERTSIPDGSSLQGRIEI